MTNVSSFIKGTNQIYIQGSPEPVIQHQELAIKNNQPVPMAIDMYDETLKEFNRKNETSWDLGKGTSN